MSVRAKSNLVAGGGGVSSELFEAKNVTFQGDTAYKYGFDINSFAGVGTEYDISIRYLGKKSLYRSNANGDYTEYDVGIFNFDATACDDETYSQPSSDISVTILRGIFPQLLPEGFRPESTDGSSKICVTFSGLKHSSRTGLYWNSYYSPNSINDYQGVRVYSDGTIALGIARRSLSSTVISIPSTETTYVCEYNSKTRAYDFTSRPSFNFNYFVY